MFEGDGTETFITEHVLIQNTLNKNKCLKETALKLFAFASTVLPW